MRKKAVGAIDLGCGPDSSGDAETGGRTSQPSPARRSDLEPVAFRDEANRARELCLGRGQRFLA